MVASVFHAPSQFFELTPSGRTINRFCSDVGTLDLVMPFTVRSMINTIEGTVITFGVIAFNLPSFLTVIPVFAVLYYIVQVGRCGSFSLLLPSSRSNLLVLHSLCISNYLPQNYVPRFHLARWSDHINLF